jgi:serine/threonine protein kinase
MTELRLFCKQCRAFHSAYDEECHAGAPPTSSHAINEERLLHERNRVVGQLDVKSTGRVGWGKDGETLEEYITPEIGSPAQTGSRPLAPSEVFTIGIQLCELLNYLHTQHPEIIVGHLHPSTIMRTSANQIVFIGLYKTYALQQSLELDTTGSRMTTGIATRRGYSAPELITRADIPSMEKRTQQASIYSLGVLLHQLCTGYDPSETPFIFAPIRTLQHPALEIFDHLLQRMLHRDPQQRPHTFGEVEASLRQIQCYYTMIKADIPEVISPYEAAIETPQLSIPFLPRL